MLGMLTRGEADFALGPFGVIHEREEACDFSQPLIIDYWATLVPVRLTQDQFPMAKTFDIATWLLCFLMVPAYFIVVGVSGTPGENLHSEYTCL